MNLSKNQVTSSFGKEGKLFSMRSRPLLPESKESNPSPADYSPNYPFVLPDPHSTTILNRIESKEQPSDVQYHFFDNHNTTPGITIGQKLHTDIIPYD
jgi:hypothetical protein